MDMLLLVLNIYEIKNDVSFSNVHKYTSTL